MLRDDSNRKSRITKILSWLGLTILIGGIIAGVWWWNYWSSPERDLDRGKQVLEQFEKAIDPEKLRAWALPYLSDESATNLSIIIPPKQISHLIGEYPVQVLEDTGTGSRFVCLCIQMGGFGPYARIEVGATNATVSQARQYGVRIKWRDGIYYLLDRG